MVKKYIDAETGEIRLGLDLEEGAAAMFPPEVKVPRVVPAHQIDDTYVVVPDKFWRLVRAQRGLRPVVQYLLAHLVLRMQPDGVVADGQKAMAEDLGLAQPQVSRALAELEAMGIIRQEPVARGYSRMKQAVVEPAMIRSSSAGRRKRLDREETQQRLARQLGQHLQQYAKEEGDGQ